MTCRHHSSSSDLPIFGSKQTEINKNQTGKRGGRATTVNDPHIQPPLTLGSSLQSIGKSTAPVTFQPKHQASPSPSPSITSHLHNTFQSSIAQNSTVNTAPHPTTSHPTFQVLRQWTKALHQAHSSRKTTKSKSKFVLFNSTTTVSPAKHLSSSLAIQHSIIHTSNHCSPYIPVLSQWTKARRQ